MGTNAWTFPQHEFTSLVIWCLMKIFSLLYSTHLNAGARLHAEILLLRLEILNPTDQGGKYVDDHLINSSANHEVSSGEKTHPKSMILCNKRIEIYWEQDMERILLHTLITKDPT